MMFLFLLWRNSGDLSICSRRASVVKRTSLSTSSKSSSMVSWRSISASASASSEACNISSSISSLMALQILSASCSSLTCGLKALLIVLTPASQALTHSLLSGFETTAPAVGNCVLMYLIAAGQTLSLQRAPAFLNKPGADFWPVSIAVRQYSPAFPLTNLTPFLIALLAMLTAPLMMFLFLLWRNSGDLSICSRRASVVKRTSLSTSSKSSSMVSWRSISASASASSEACNISSSISSLMALQILSASCSSLTCGLKALLIVLTPASQALTHSEWSGFETTAPATGNCVLMYLIAAGQTLSLQRFPAFLNKLGADFWPALTAVRQYSPAFPLTNLVPFLIRPLALSIAPLMMFLSLLWRNSGDLFICSRRASVVKRTSL